MAKTKTLTPTQARRQRLGTVVDWLADGVSPEAATERAMSMWYPKHRQRAERLIAQADKMLRGVTASFGGRPVEIAKFSAGIGEQAWITAQDGTRQAVSILSGDGTRLTWRDMMTGQEYTLAPVDWFAEGAKAEPAQEPASLHHGCASLPRPDALPAR